MHRYTRVFFAVSIALAVPSVGAQAGGLPAEIATRQAADAQLQSNINAEAAARIAAIEELRASIGGGESSIVGRYALTGTSLCIGSSTGFRTDSEFEPNLVFPPPPTFPPTPTPPGSVIQVNSNTVSGVRTFNADGTGSAVATFHTITHPTSLTQIRAGGASITTLDGTFRYVVDGDNLVIEDDPAIGTITKGGRAVGGQISIAGAPRFVGKISKDRKIISLTQEDLAVEQATVTPVGGAPQTTPRVCHRERTLYRID